MRVRVTLKDPDVMFDAVHDACRDYYLSDRVQGIDKQARLDLIEVDAQTISGVITTNWMRYGEYLDVEFDTEAMTATVLPAKS